MKKLLSLLLGPTTLLIVGLLAVSMLIWIVGPQVSIDDWRPLDSARVRIVVIATLVCMLVLPRLWRALRARIANGVMVRQLMTRPPRPAPDVEPGEAEHLRRRFDAALQTLRTARFASSSGIWGSLRARAGKRYLYELPWYTIIGLPGAGKTTALLNSGLRFPLAGALGQDAASGARRGQGALTGIAGTRNIDWWFTDEAVLIDTAGRYTSQDSDPAVDREAWLAFLALLKKSRPRLPVNGVLVTISVPDLLGASVAERADNMTRLRARIQELHGQLGVRFPIYVLVTKCDLLAGFMDTLGNADRDTRAAPWGFTFPLDERQRSDIRTFGAEFDALAQRLVDGVIDRMQAERDVGRRARIYSFPQQFGALRSGLEEFLGSVFSPSQFEDRPMLRGVYFISGTQEGTPLDRVLGQVARAHGLERALLPPNQNTAKSFFLERLLREVVFAESELGGTDLKWERRRGGLAATGYAGIATLAAVSLTAWAVSYANNRAYVDAVAARIGTVAEQAQRPSTAASSDLVALLPALRATRALADEEASTASHRLTGFGLEQRAKLDSAAEQAHRRLLAQAFLPALAMRLEAQLVNGADNPELQYEALKAHVMLHDRQRFDADALRTYFRHDWDATLDAGVSAEQRAELHGHLEALLTLRTTLPYTAASRVLTDRVRASLASAPLAQRVYNRMRRQGVGDQTSDFSVAKAGGPSAALVFQRTSGKPLTLGVPGRYTYDGYQAFQADVTSITERLGQEEAWVLGVQDAMRAGKRFDSADLKRLSDEVRKLYLTDYARVWQSYIGDIRLVPMDTLDKTIQTARVLSGPTSPLKPVLVALSHQTTLSKPNSVIDKGRTQVQSAFDDATKGIDILFGSKKPAAGALRADAPIESMVDEKFTALRAHVTGVEDGKGPAPIDKTLAMLDEIVAKLSAAQQAQRDGSPAPPVNAPLPEIAKLPEPLRSMLQAVVRSGTGSVNKDDIAMLLKQLRADVGDFCRAAIAGRYPVVRSSTDDIRPQDFAALFGPNGRMDKFFQKYLVNRVDSTRRPWTTRLVEGQPAVIDSVTLMQFQRAAVIRDTYFPAGSVLPSLRLQLAPAAMDPSILNFILDVDGQIVRYAHGPAIPVSVQWPGPQNSTQVRVQLSPPTVGGPSGQTTQGPWALQRLFDTARLTPSKDDAHFRAAFDVGGRRAEFEVIASSVFNPFRLRELNEFSCPGSG